MKDVLKILVVTPSYKPAFVYGGPTRSITELCERLALNTNATISVFTTTANGAFEIETPVGLVQKMEGVSVVYFNRWTGDHSHLSPRLLINLWVNCRTYDIVHIQSWWNLVSVLSTIICFSRGCIPVISPRGTMSQHTFSAKHTWIKKMIHSLFGELLLRKAVLHATSVKELNDVQRMVPGARVEVIPNILPLAEHFTKSANLSDNVLRILYVGRIDPIKNIELIIEALRYVKADVKWRLTILGDGQPEYVNSLKVLSKGLPSIEWLGNVDGEEKQRLMAESDLLVLLSFSENFGNVIIEALNQGTPVLISKYVGLSEYVLHHGLGWVVDLDINECVAVIEEIAGNSELRRNIAHRARLSILRDFDNKALLLKYLELYESVIKYRVNTLHQL